MKRLKDRKLAGLGFNSRVVVVSKGVIEMIDLLALEVNLKDLDPRRHAACAVVVGGCSFNSEFCGRFRSRLGR